MRELMAKAHLAQPTFESSRERNEFTIRLLLHHFLGPEDLVWLAKFNKDGLNDAQKTALIFVREIGAIDNSTYRQLGNCDTLRASMDLRKLRDKGLLSGKGKGSATYYVPGGKLTVSSETPHAPAQTPQAFVEMPPAVPGDFSWALQADLRALGKHCRREKLNALIIRLCTQRPLTRQNLAVLLQRDESNLKKLLKTLVETHRLRYLYPEMIKHPKQAYFTNLSSEEHHE